MRPGTRYRDDLGMTTTEHGDPTEITTPPTRPAIAVPVVAVAADPIAGLPGRRCDR
jgi:hypothetical protein